MAETTMKLKPWLTPTYVLVEMPPRPKQDGIQALPSLHVSEITPEALNEMVRKWLHELYAKAEKTCPFND